MESPRLIKKYPNRRLYDTWASAYITLCEIKGYVLSHIPFRVVDARNQQDLTRCILMQIILDEELGKSSPLFSCDMLSQMIRAYGSGTQEAMGNHLEQSLRHAIERWQETPPTLAPASSSASPTQLMKHYLNQINQLYLAMQRPDTEALLHNQAMGSVNGQHTATDETNLPQRRAKIHPTV